MGLFNDPDAPQRIQCAAHKGYILPCILCEKEFDADARKDEDARRDERPDKKKAYRHRWAKLKVHNYVCIICGMTRENVEEGPAYWVSRWWFPTTDTTRVEKHVPACVIGPHTSASLARHQDAIDQALMERAK